MTKTGMTQYRWAICSLIFFATTINYIDRSVISFLKSTFTEQQQWTDGDYANVEITFKVFYAIGLLGAGRLIDRLGTKVGYGLSAFLWSLSGIATSLAGSVFSFQIVRGALGLTEAGNFPAAIKTVAEWFPKKERALATGIFNSGANIGAIITPLTVPFILIHWGWQWAFIITGCLGLMWVMVWMTVYKVPREHKHISLAELNFIEHDRESEKGSATDNDMPKQSWLQLLKLRQTWAFATGKLLTDPIWWFYLFWLPDFFESIYHIKISGASLPVAAVYILSTFGSVGGGWLPLYLINNKGWAVARARQISMLIYALCVLPILLALILGSVNMWLAVVVIGIAAAAHQAWSANILTTVSDMFPARSIASVTGIGGMFGALGGIILSLFVQKTLFTYYRSIDHIETAYYIMFFVCGSAYISAWLIMQALTGKVKPVNS
jgi:ACS family hexuronate transporter-like MFS transporter